MMEFMDRLVTVALPRIRDFRGISPKAFDGRGNYTLGLKEQLTFPEIKYDDVASIHGMDITFVTSAPRNDEAKSLLAYLGMPFRKS
ncbi:MAG: 50S ribosomal protein L5, partial [Nitrospirales bacterium]|nr:50S ribosomal protein L5 [Nitrospirales bacterium]